MPNTIPPLVCNTPPPIDDSDEDLSATNDCNYDHFDGESLPSSPKRKHTSTIRVRDNLPMPDIVSTTPVATDSPLSIECELDAQHKIEDLDNLSVVPDDDLYFDGSDTKLRSGSDSAIGDVYSNGNSLTNTSKEADGSHSLTDLKPSETLSEEKHDAHTTIDSDRNEMNSENALSVEQSDNLSSSPSWNLDVQTPEPEFGSLSTQGELNSIENPCQMAADAHSVKEIPETDATNTTFPDDNTKTSVPLDDASPPPPQTSQINQYNDIESNVASYEDTFDEIGNDTSIQFNANFDQFATFDDEAHVLKSTQPNSHCDNDEIAFDDDDDDDDEFGEFSDFQQTPTAQTVPAVQTVQSVQMPVTQKDVIQDANVLLDSENIKLNLSSILATIFPSDGNCDVVSSNRSDHVSYDKEQFINNLTAQLRNVENSNALRNQWAKSTSKTVLVKALGIDSRNILYGEKWNSSAPKFAANLGLSPLEPMKVTSSTAMDGDVKGAKSVLDVPAAQFDWNSSGLINPLDALHAHTLLLDLEQLVVVANLDKINLNSSSSACSTTNSAQNYQSSNSSSKMTTTTTIISTTSYQNVSTSILPLNEMKLANRTKQRSTYQHEFDHTMDMNNQINKTNFIKCTNGFNTVNHTMRFDTNVKPLVTDKSFDSYFSAQKPTHEENFQLNVKPTQKCIPTTPSMAAPVPDSSTAPPPLSEPIVDSLSMIQPTVIPTKDLCTESIDPDLSQTSDSYTVPGSSGTMKETHIFTPLKPTTVSISSMVNEASLPALVPNGMMLRPEMPATDNDSIVIIESVVKKEYRDVEYEPSKVLNAPSDDFTEFQFVQPTTDSNTDIIEPNPIKLNPTNQVNSMSFLPDPSDNNGHVRNMSNDKYLNSFDSSSVKSKNAPSIDHFQMPTIGSFPSDLSKNNSSLHNGNRREFQSYSMNEALPPSNNVTATDTIHEQFGCATDPIEIFSISSLDQSKKQTQTQTQSQKHSYSTIFNPKSNASTQMPSNALSNTPELLKPQNNNNSTAFISSSNMLMPQTVNMPSMSTTYNNAPVIQWPEPGINSDQLEQLERRFFDPPQQNVDAKCDKIESKVENNDTSGDDEWSDFVSVVQPQTPITNILNKNLLKQQNNDEDDWSEFVSSTPLSLQRIQQNTIPTDTNTNYESMFKTWNTPFQSGTTQSTKKYEISANPLRKSATQHVPNGESNTFQSTQQQTIVPSIISLPDLGFVAPKSLLNMPNRSIAKK